MCHNNRTTTKQRLIIIRIYHIIPSGSRSDRPPPKRILKRWYRKGEDGHDVVDEDTDIVRPPMPLTPADLIMTTDNKRDGGV